MMKLIIICIMLATLIPIAYHSKETAANTAAILHILNVAASK